MNSHLPSKRLEIALAALTEGRPIILRDSSDRENEGDLAFAARNCTPALVNFALSHARGLLCVAIDSETVLRLGIDRLKSNRRDSFDTPFGMPVSLSDGGTGISASARSQTIRALADPVKNEGDFCMPGHIATLIAHKDGLAARQGHTEAIVDLLRIGQLGGAGVLCEILNEKGEIASEKDLLALSAKHNIPVLGIDEIASYLSQKIAVQ